MMYHAADLVLVRHATAEPATGASTDERRRLTERGTLEAAAMADFLRRALATPLHRDAVLLSSPYVRTMQTSMAIAHALALEVSPDDALRADRSAEGMLDSIAARSESCIVVVGHMPTLSHVVSNLLHVSNAVVDIPPGTAVGMRWESRLRRWASLCWLMTPQLWQQLQGAAINKDSSHGLERP